MLRISISSKIIDSTFEFKNPTCFYSDSFESWRLGESHYDRGLEYEKLIPEFVGILDLEIS